MYTRFTPSNISTLNPSEVFVFGSNLAGHHAGGAARTAYRRFGATWGVGVGLEGQSYAIPTMHGGVDAIKPYVDQFIDFARANRHLTFLVTRIGCGIAGFDDKDIAPLFKGAINDENICLPEQFVRCIEEEARKVAEKKEVKWSADAFLAKYRYLKERVAKGYSEAYAKIKELRVEEFLNTVGIANQGYYTASEGVKVTLPNPVYMVLDSVLYSQPFYVHEVRGYRAATMFKVANADCLEAGIRLKKMGYNPAILNMASRSTPGGGVLTGAGAQEENIFRRTNLFQSLYQFTDEATYQPWYEPLVHPHIQRGRYPMDRNFGGIYTPNATLFREGEHAGYRLMEHPVALSFISVAAINRPPLKDATHLADSMVVGTKNKIRTILRIGLRHGHDSLVLSAFGCGAYRNPPSHMARLFHDVFEEPEFKDKYRYVWFAILDDHNSHLSHNPDGNLLPFARVFA